MPLSNYFMFFEIICLFMLLECTERNEEQGRKDSSCPGKAHNLYSKEYSEYMDAYLKQKKAYQPSSVFCYNATILENLSAFKNGITKEIMESAFNKGVKYQLINHQLYRSTDCIFPTRCSGVEYFLNSLRNELPDFECVINFYDWPQVSRHHGSPVPVFSFSKTDDYYDIMYPAWSFWEGGPAIKIYPKGLGRWDLHRKSLLLAAKKWPWEKKKKTYFFRGSRTSPERDTLILSARRNPELVNASYTKNQAWKSEKDTLGFPPAEEVPLEEHCMYRYLFNFRGVTASFRFKYLFLCKSVVLHVGKDWKEFFYDYLKPWTHYIPIRHDATEEEYRSLMDFIVNEDEIAQEIAEEGYKFITKNLKMEDILCYWKNLLLQYSRLLKFKPTLDRNLKKISLS